MTDETEPGIDSVRSYRKEAVLAELFVTFADGETAEARIAETGCPNRSRYPQHNPDNAQPPRTQLPIAVQRRAKGCCESIGVRIGRVAADSRLGHQAPVFGVELFKPFTTGTCPVKFQRGLGTSDRTLRHSTRLIRDACDAHNFDTALLESVEDDEMYVRGEKITGRAYKRGKDPGGPSGKAIVTSVKDCQPTRCQRRRCRMVQPVGSLTSRLATRSMKLGCFPMWDGRIDRHGAWANAHTTVSRSRDKWVDGMRHTNGMGSSERLSSAATTELSARIPARQWNATSTSSPATSQRNRRDATALRQQAPLKRILITRDEHANTRIEMRI